MGLDMYLEKKIYCKQWDHFSEEEKTKITVAGKLANIINTERISYIVEEVGYWRKANAIHN